MKVGFDISQLAHPGGVATYTQNLAKRLEKRKDLEIVFFYSSLRKPYKGDLKNVKQFKFPPSLLEIMFNKLRLPTIESLIGEVDVFHSSDWTQPPSKAKKVTTYHDVVPLKFPQWSHPKIVEVQKRRLKIVEKEVDMIIAVSESTKKDLLEISNIDQKKITVIYEGVDGQFKPQNKEDIERFRRKYNLHERFILAIGGIGERRNMKRIKEASEGYKLVITGENLPLLPFSELPLLYGAASVLLYPSFYEGFGLPILEAMACGTPVVTSNVSSMPEVGGEAALYVDPNNAEQIKKRLIEVMEDDKLREGIIKRGFEQAGKFSWEKCADKTVELYKKISVGR